MSIAEDLVRLHQLHQDGGLTEAEFALAKAKILAVYRPMAEPQAIQRDGGFADGGGVSETQPTAWPHGARVAAIVLLIVIALLAAPIAYRAFENWVFSHAEWTFIRE